MVGRLQKFKRHPAAALTPFNSAKRRIGIENKLSFVDKKRIVRQRHKNPKLSGWQLSTHKNFPNEVRETVFHDKPEKPTFSSHDIAKECVMNVLGAPHTPSPPPTPPPLPP